MGPGTEIAAADAQAPPRRGELMGQEDRYPQLHIIRRAGIQANGDLRHSFDRFLPRQLNAYLAL